MPLQAENPYEKDNASVTGFNESHSSIDKSSHIPAYAQLQEKLRGQIMGKRVAPGDRLPSENDLSRQYRISRMTVRQALRGLIREGLIVVRKGEGSFVSHSPDVQMLITLDGFSTEMQKRGHRVHSQFLEIAAISSVEAACRAFLCLGGKKNSSLVRIKRLRFLDDRPFAIEASYMSFALGQDLLGRPLDRDFSIYGYLSRERKIDLAKAEYVIEPLTANSEQAKLLRIKAGRPVLSMSGTTNSVDGLPVEYLEGIYLGDKYKLRISIGK